MISAASAYCQNTAEEVLSRIQDNRISLDYSCTVKADVSLSSKGNLTVQQNCYRLISQDIEIYCDGSTRWYVDRSSREVYVEKSEGTPEYLNPDYVSAIESLKLKNVVYLPLDDDISIFTFDCSSLGKDWIITDLR